MCDFGFSFEGLPWQKYCNTVLYRCQYTHLQQKKIEFSYCEKSFSAVVIVDLCVLLGAFLVGAVTGPYTGRCGTDFWLLVRWVYGFVRFVGSFWDGAITSPYTGQCMLKQCPEGQKFQHTSPFRPCGTDFWLLVQYAYWLVLLWGSFLVLWKNCKLLQNDSK